MGPLHWKLLHKDLLSMDSSIILGDYLQNLMKCSTVLDEEALRMDESQFVQLHKCQTQYILV
jgi:hypothetical protein